MGAATPRCLPQQRGVQGVEQLDPAGVEPVTRLGGPRDPRLQRRLARAEDRSNQVVELRHLLRRVQRLGELVRLVAELVQRLASPQGRDPR